MDAVLIYHSVGGVPGTDYKWDLPTSQFQATMKTLADRYEIVDLGTLIADPGSPRKRIAVTFDDAFRNVYNNAVPVLRKLGVPATVFVCPAYIGDDNERKLRTRHNMAESAHDIVMTAEQLAELANDDLFTLGNHTASHPDLTTVSDREDVVAEIVEGKTAIEDWFGVDVDRFAYPYGQIDDQSADIVGANHDLAVTSVPSLLDEDINPTRIPRLDGCQPAPVACFEVSDFSARMRAVVRGVRSEISR